MSQTRSQVARVRELFDAALQRPEGERRSFVLVTCGGDGDLATEVLALLEIDHADSSEGELAGGGAAWLAGAIGDDLDTGPEAAPAAIGPFRVVKELGRGGMGVVYEAEQREPLRRVALKLVHPGVIGPSALKRFRREMRAMASLRHPGIVQLFEVGSAELVAGAPLRPFLAMELVEGRSLRDYVAEATPTLEQQLAILAMLCDAVHHAHQKGVVHRDLKPENILVQTDAGTAGLTGIASLQGVQPKILDFGVSRLMEAHDSTTVQTMAGQVIGTVPYLSPEQIAGDSEGTDTRSDVYALGVIAFELLAGQQPFDVARLPLPDALRVIAGQEPARLRSVRRGIPPDVETIVHKAMQRDPAQRYQSAADMGADIRRFLTHEPILARRPSWGYLASRFVRRHQALTSVVAVALTLLLASLLIITLLWSDAKRTREAAVWQTYRSAMGAASAAIAAGDIATARRELDATPPKHRGWEFDHLASRLDQSERVLRPDVTAPFSVLPESDQRAILVRRDGLTRIDLSTGARTVDQPDPRLTLWYAAACSRFPPTIAITSREFWRPDLRATGGVVRFEPVAWPEWQVARVVQACRNADDSVIAMLLGNNERHAVLVCHFKDSNQSRLISLGPKELVSRMAISPDGRRLVLATSEADPTPRRIRNIDVGTGQLTSETEALPRPVFSMVARNSGVVTAVLQDGSMETWDLSLSTARRVARRAFDHDAAENLTLSADGQLLMSGSRDGLVRLFDAETLELGAELFGSESEIVDVQFTRDNRHVISTGQDGSIRLWSRTPPKPNPLVLRGHTHLVHPIVYLPRHNRVITGGWDSEVSVYSAEDAARSATTRLDNIVLTLAISHDERLLATRELGGRVRLLDAETLSLVSDVREPVIELDQPAFSTDDRRLLLRLDPPGAQAMVWNIANRATETLPGSVLRDFSSPMLNATWKLITSTEARNDGRFTVVYNFETGTEVFALPTSRSAVESLVFAPDEQTFVIPDRGNNIVMYQLPDFQPIRRFRGHTREVLAMAFSPNGARLFSADLTGVIRVWDTRTGDQVAELRGHESHIRRLVVSPDGRLLISGSRDCTARIWRADALDASAVRK